MEDNLERDQGENWLRDWEEQTTEEWENEIKMDERIAIENERFAQRLWQNFQNSATAIAQLYRERCSNPSACLWVPFQNSASGVTIMYKDSLECMKRNLEMGIQCGQQRRTKDLLSWARKKRRHIRREDLIAYLCGKNPPVRPRPTTALSKTPSRLMSERSSPRLPPMMSSPLEDQNEPDLQPFRDALALQRLNGAMSNISVGFQGHSDGPPTSVSRDQCGADDDFHCFILDEITRHCDTRKRSSQSDVIMDSPSRKRSRLL